MKKSRLKTLTIGLILGVIYAFGVMLLVTYFHKNVSVSYIFILPLILGAIPVLFSTKEQLQAYKGYLLLPWGITMTFFFLAWSFGFEGMICLSIIVAPFLMLGTLGAFIFRIIKLKNDGKKGTKLYFSLLIPLVCLIIENNINSTNQIYEIKTNIIVNSDRENIWQNIVNVKDIEKREIGNHFIHLIGIPKPLNGEIDREEIGGVREITWEKGIKFEEKITAWKKGYGFSYDINVNPNSIPPRTLDEHVMIGGKYFDVIRGSYKIEEISKSNYKITLSCTYRVTTNLNLYSKLWADFILNDFNKMILKVIKVRCEAKK